jgi:hypothetical protein
MRKSKKSLKKKVIKSSGTLRRTFFRGDVKNEELTIPDLEREPNNGEIVSVCFKLILVFLSKKCHSTND